MLTVVPSLTRAIWYHVDEFITIPNVADSIEVEVDAFFNFIIGYSGFGGSNVKYQ